MEFDTLIMLAAGIVAAGAVVGFLAGLFGIGGGAISVPVLFQTFLFLNIDEAVAMPMAVGTSLAVIIPTSLQSARGHYLRGALDMNVLKIWAIPLLIGVTTGSVIARYANPWVFQLVFAFVATILGMRLLAGGKNWRISDHMPGPAVQRIYGTVIGFLSSLMGVGGGAMATMAFTLHGVPIHNAVATSAGMGVLISIPGTIGYILAGWGKPGLPPDAVGYISLLGFVLLVPTSLLTARLGVRAAHALSRRALEISFGVFLLLVAVRFAYALTA